MSKEEYAKELNNKLGQVYDIMGHGGYNSGTSGTFTLLVDAYGKPMIYEGG